MAKKIKRFYLMPSVWATVTNSQVFNWIKLLDEKGIETDCISITNEKLSKEEADIINSEINGQFHQISYKRYLVSDFYLLLNFLVFYFKSVFTYDRIIFQTRLPKIAFPFVLMGLLYKVKIIYEARGAITEERDHVSRNRQHKNLKFRFRTSFINVNEKFYIKYSDRVICVSHTLKTYYQKKYNLLKSDKFHVFPGAADNTMFYLDQNIRSQGRKELNFTNKDIVVIYSGKLNKEWEIPNDVFNFMSKLISFNEHVKFLVITPDLDIAKTYTKKHKINASTIILKSEFEEVNRYLNTGDISLMLREDVMMNNVASPTKFSEYVLSGIPCIMSKGVYDFAQIINETGFGVVLSDYKNLKEMEYDRILKLLELDREKISLWGKENLSKEVLISKYYDLLTTI